MKRRKLLSALLALIMLLSLLPVSSFAESDVEVPEAAVAEQIIDETPAEEVAAEEAVEEVPAVEEIVEEVPAVEEIVEEPEVVEEEPEEEPIVNAIVAQPQDLTVVNGERAVFSVEVTGNAVYFQWQSSRDNRRWSNLNAWYYGSDAELGFYPTRSDNGYYFRVVVTFENGEQLISEAARLSVASVVITAQPQDLSVEPDSEAVFTVGAKGSVSYYQWQYSANGSRWSNLNTRYYGSSNTLRFIAEAEDDGLYIRALVYGRDGSRIATEAAKLTVKEPEPVVTYEARTLAPEVSIPGVALTVDAPEGALPSNAALNIETVNAAAYSDAIPLDLLKSEQQKIAKELAGIEHEIRMHNTTFEQITQNLNLALDVVEDCGQAYRNASDTIKKLMNQAIFEKFYISNGPEDEFDVKVTFKAPYDQILDPIKEDLLKINTAVRNKSERIEKLIEIVKTTRIAGGLHWPYKGLGLA